MASRGGRLLVNFVYCHPVGHVIEALHYCHGYHLAAPEITVAVVLNARSPVELAGPCRFVNACYPVRLDVSDPLVPVDGLEAIPAGWDWVVDDARGRQAQQRAVFPGIGAYYDRAAEYFTAARAAIGTAGAAPPAYQPGGQWRLTLPGPAQLRARDLLTGSGGLGRWPRIAVLPFYSVLPDTRRFPAFHQFGPGPEPVDDDGPRSPSMSYQRIAADLEEILDGTGRLIEERWPFPAAMADHVARMLAIHDGRADLLWSIDDVHTRYLPGNTGTAKTS